MSYNPHVLGGTLHEQKKGRPYALVKKPYTKIKPNVEVRPYIEEVIPHKGRIGMSYRVAIKESYVNTINPYVNNIVV